MQLSEKKFAFVELAKFFLGFNYIPGKTAGFNPSPDDVVVCLDMIVNFPEELIDEYLRVSGQGSGKVRSLRDLAHAIVNTYYNRTNHVLYSKRDNKYKSIVEFVKQWKLQFE